MKPLEFQKQRNFKRLLSHYRTEPIVLYVGAGISASRDPEYGLPGWPDLLKALCRDIARCEPAVLPADPWDAADCILELCVERLKEDGWQGDDPQKEAERRLQKTLWKLVRKPKNFLTQGREHPYKLLNKAFLENARTLRAVAAFCARPIGRSQGAEVYRFAANSRVRAVISGNYDPFLESASTSMFKISVLKPVTAFGSLAGNLREVPIHHIHGYVPHPAQVPGDDHRPLQKQLVLTRKSYLKAWNEKDVFCATMLPQVYLLRQYTALFIGFSFTDPKITELLEKIWKEYPESKRRERWNYAILRRAATSPGQVQKLEWMGIKPILVEEYKEIPELLGEVYTAGLQHDHPDGMVVLPRYAGQKIALPLDTHKLSCKKIWDMLYTCHQSHPGVLDRMK